MRPQYSIANPPAAEPVTYEQAAAHLRVDSTDDMEYIRDLIPVAREYVDSVTGLAAMPMDFLLIAEDWQSLFATASRSSGVIDPRYGLTGTWRDYQTIPVWRSPLVSVASVKYYATDASELSTMSASDYRVVTNAAPGMIQITGDLPSLESRPDAVQITFRAGIQEASAIHRHAIKSIVGHLYENRLPVAFSSCQEIPYTLAAMIGQIKVGGWLA